MRVAATSHRCSLFRLRLRHASLHRRRRGRAHRRQPCRRLYDAWLTVGINDGDANGALGSIGIDFDTWTADGDYVEASNGAVFLVNPDAGPSDPS